MAKFALAAALLLAVAGYAETAVKPRKTVASTPTTDAKTEQAIRARFAKSKIAADHFQVEVRGGVATLSGKTDIAQRKGVATRLAKAGGAEQVVNNIEVSEQGKKRAAKGLAEARKRVEVKRVPAETR